MDVRILAVLVTLLAAMIFAALNYWFSRKGDKHSKKTEIRTQSYIDYLNCVSKLAKSSGNCDRESLLAELTDSKCRIVVYGDRKVVRALADFDRGHQVLDTPESIDLFMKVVAEMRVDATGKELDVQLSNLKQILFR